MTFLGDIKYATYFLQEILLNRGTTSLREGFEYTKLELGGIVVLASGMHGNIYY
jgi:hypothetical protein